MMRPGAVDVDRRLAEAFQAPEGVWNRDADRIRLDVFALGALAYYVLAGRPAAADRAALRERLHRDNGLDLAADLPQVPSAVRALVLEATRPAVSRAAARRPRLPRAAGRRRDGPGRAGRGGRRPAGGGARRGHRRPVPAGAPPRRRLHRRRPAGHRPVGGRPGRMRPGCSRSRWTTPAAGRIAGEAEVLAGLNDPRLVRLVEGPVEVGGRKALVLESAGDETLGRGAAQPGAAVPGPAGAVGHRPAGGAGRAGPGGCRPPGHQAGQPRASGRAAATGPSTWSCSTSPCPARARPR